jgi:phenylalanyl-tRNA synthetase beta chain
MLLKERQKEDEDVKNASDEILYKIEVAANRYDLLCEEGLVRALMVYVGKDYVPNYKTIEGKIKMKVESDVIFNKLKK